MPEDVAELLNSEEGKRAIAEAAEELANSRVEDAVGGLKNKNSELLSEVKKLKAFKSELGDDFDPEEYQTLRKAKQKAEEDRAKAEGNWEKLKNSLVEQHQKEVQSLQGKLSQQQTAVETYLIDAQVKAALSDAGANVHLMENIVKNSVRAVAENGAYKVVVVDEKGDPRIGSSDGSFMTIPQLVKELSERSEFAPAFSGTGATGTGSGGQRGKVGSGTKKVSEMNNAEKAALISEIGAEAYHNRRRAGM